jgi:hypothetical protein
MTPAERVAALRWYGYTPRQAAFLALVLLHTGYFLRRQFATFLGREDGGLITDFVERLVRNRHARRHVFRRHTEVIHVFGRPLYHTIGEPGCRHRRAVSLATVVERLMVIDLVLAHPHAMFLATEREKVAFLRSRAPEHLYPGRWMSGPKAAGPRRGHVFVDKAPLYLEPADGPLHVAYVQGPAATVAGFARRLQDYAGLLTRLNPVTVVFCTAADGSLADAARAVFARWRQTRPFVLDEVPESVWRGEVVAYFRGRRRVETAGSPGASEADRARVVEGRQRFGELRSERLYARWTVLGDVQIERFCNEERVPRLDHVKFLVERLPHRYAFFANALTPASPRPSTPASREHGPERSP